MPDAARAWNAIGENWADMQGEHGDGNQQFIINPALFSLLGEVVGLRVLDAACGGGHVSRALARRGATVTGVDISATMIAAARRASAELAIDFRVADLSAMPEFAGCSFDAVVCSMALMNVVDIAGAFGEFARVLKPGGRLVFSVPHPCYPRRPGSHGVQREGDADWLEYFRVGSYLEEGECPMSLPSADGEFHPVPTFHRTLTTLITLLVDSGFVVDGLIEPMPPDTPEAKQELGLGWWDATRRIAYYLVMRARRL
jgi:SAM-dependent methyltransferase